MDFEYSAKVKGIEKKLRGFMEEFIYPNEARHAEQITAGGSRRRSWTN